MLSFSDTVALLHRNTAHMSVAGRQPSRPWSISDHAAVTAIFQPALTTVPEPALTMGAPDGARKSMPRKWCARADR